MFSSIIQSEIFQETWEIVKSQFLISIWETVYVTILSTLFAFVIGLPLGILLVVGEENNILPVPKWILRFLNLLINILRSIPFLILMILVFPITRFIMGTVVGTMPTIVPLVIASFPFVARLVESSIREINPNTIEMAQSLGATPFQIIFKVMIPESIPSLISNATIAVTTILGYTAMSGILGGGGLGKIAINYGYYRYKTLVMILAVILLVLLVQALQTIGTKIAVKTNKKLRK